MKRSQPLLWLTALLWPGTSLAPLQAQSSGVAAPILSVALHNAER